MSNLPKTVLIHEALSSGLLTKAALVHASQHYTGGSDELTPANIGAQSELGANLGGLTEQTVIVDANLIPLVDGTTLKKTLWSTIKSTLKTYFDGLYLALSGGTLTGTLTLDGGSTTVAPLKFEDNDVLTTPQAGVIEFNGGRFHITNEAVRRGLMSTSDVLITTVTVTNTVTETTIWTGSLAANTLKAGDIMEIFLSGVITNASAADDITFRKYIGSTLVEEFAPAIGNVTSAEWTLDNYSTVRSIGATGSLAFHGKMDINGNIDHVNSINVIDTTATENFTFTVQWANAKVGNTISIYQGWMDFSHG